MNADRVEQLGVAVEDQRDPVGHVKARVPTTVLDDVDDLTGQALGAQRAVDLQLERDRMRAFALDLVALERLHAEQQVVGSERVLRAADVDCDPPAVT